MGSAELLVFRVLSPLVAHVPPLGSAVGTRAGSLLDTVGEGAGSATAVLVIAGAALWIAVDGRRDRVVGGALLLSLVAAGGLTALPVGAGQGVARVLLLLAVAVLAGGAAARLTPLHAVTISVAALGVAAAQVPLLVDSLSGHGTPVGWFELAEGARLATFVLLALTVARRGTASSRAFAAAAVTTIGAAALLAREPSSAAILSTWAVGATLALPVSLYILASGCAVFVLVASLRDAGTRHLAVGLLLLTVAGVQPSFVHHNVTAILAIAVLARPISDVLVSYSSAPPASPRAGARLFSSESAVAAAE
jgi:hypothetical protein